MSGWTMIAFDAEYEDKKKLKKQILRHLKNRELWGKITDYQGDLLIMIGGYREWSEDENLLNRTSNYWDRAAVLQTNDTGDVGHAKYYKKYMKAVKPVTKVDEFKENELCHGRPTGAKASAYMTLHHGMYLLPSLNRPREHNTVKIEGGKIQNDKQQD